MAEHSEWVFNSWGIRAVLIRTAYGLPVPDQIEAAPKWAGTEHFDIEVKMDEETTARLPKLPGMDQWRQRQEMFRALLAERFALKLHHASKSLGVYALRVSKHGDKLTKSPSEQGGNLMLSKGKIIAKAVSLESFATNLSNLLSKITVDETGLRGNYNITLEWAPDDAPADDPRASIFSALEEQLGLSLKSEKAPVDVLVVDAMKEPTEN